ncbi:hypothetical protein HQ535_11010 [bacterium]|nr:hypothetical protein [bacterium]
MWTAYHRLVSELTLGLSAVIIAVSDEQPRILTVGGDAPALPTGLFDPDLDRTLERSLRRWVAEQTGIDLGYVEQLYTLGDRGRSANPDERLVSVAYLALVREGPAREPSAQWRDWYSFLPWEDFRDGRPESLDRILPAVEAWVDGAGEADRAARAERAERADILFGAGGSTWDVERTLERYELLWEIGAVTGGSAGLPGLGGEMALDHRRIAAQALGRLRGKLRYRPVVFELLPEVFTLTGLQRVVEALSGVRLHTQNFRRLVDRGGLVEGTGSLDPTTGGRPAEIYRFRRDVLRERPAPGVGLPGMPTSG